MKIPFQFLHVPDIYYDTIKSIVESHFNMSSCIKSVEEISDLQESILNNIQDNSKVFNNHLFLHTFLNVLHPQNIDLSTYKLQPPLLSEIQGYKNTEELFKYALRFYEPNKILPRSKFRRVCCILAVSKTGLRKEELKDCLEVKLEIVEIYLKIFNFALIEYKHQYRINNEIYKKTIEKYYMQEELFKNEIHSSIVTILSKTKHFNSNARLIDEVTYNIYKQGNQWLRLKDLLSNLEIFFSLYKPQDKYILAQYWYKLEQHGFDPVYEYNKTVEAFVLNYFPTPSELFVVLTQLGRFFKEQGDLESKCTPEFKHPPLVLSQELEQIKLQKELENIGGMLTENKQNATPTAEEERYNVENPLFMQAYRDKQVQLFKKEHPLFPQLQMYYYKRWIWLQFPWFCMDINSAFSNYMNKAMGKQIHLHMNHHLEMDLVQGCLKIIKEAKSRKQLSGKNQIYAVPIEFTLDEEQLEREREETKYSSSEDSMSSKTTQQLKSPFQRRLKSSINSPAHNTQTPRIQIQNKHNESFENQPETLFTQRETQVMSARNNRSQGGMRFLSKAQSQSRLTSSQAHRNSIFFDKSQQMDGVFRQSQYSISKLKWINQDYELANLKNKIKPENAVRVVSSQVKSYERKELDTARLSNRDMINDLNKIAFEIQQKTRILNSMQNCIITLDTNNKENQAFEKRLQTISDRLDQTKTQYRIAKKEQNRLKHIVNYCFKNKADNHEWIQGLELAVSNMITLIKHEKESVIESKNLVIQLKKESKELSNLKQERKLLQTMTTQTMYGMINEKKSIKSLREEFMQRRQQIMLGNINSTNDSIEFQQFVNEEEKKPIREKSYSPVKSVFGGERQNKSKNRNSIDNYYSNQSDLNNEQYQAQNLFIHKIDQIRLAAGVKNIDNYQQIIDFWSNYNRLIKDRDLKEQKIQSLKSEKQQLQQELGNFHQQDIDKSNNNYHPYILANNLQEKIIQAQLIKSQAYAKLKKSQNQLIDVRVMIEEIRKKLKLDNKVFQKEFKDIDGEEYVQCLFDLQNFVVTKNTYIKNIFGDLPFHDIMVQINQINPHELRMKIIKADKSKSRQSNFANRRTYTQERSQESNYQQELALQKQTNSIKEFTPQIVLHYSDESSEQKQNVSNFDNHYERIFIEDMESNFNLQPIEQTQDLLNVNFNPMTKQPKNSNDSVTVNSKRLSKRPSKFGSELLGKNFNQQKNSQQSKNNKNNVDEAMYSNIYQIPRPIFLDESSYYTQSLLNISRSLKEKETLFYKRADEIEKTQDIVQQTLNVISEFKKKSDPMQTSLDDSFKQIENQRQQIKSREKTIQSQDLQNIVKNIKKPITRASSQQKSIKPNHDIKFKQTGYVTQRNNYEDEEQQLKRDSNHLLIKDEQEHKQNSRLHSANQSKNDMILASSGSKTQRIVKFDSKQAIDNYLSGEVSKLPSYAKVILNTHHKDIVMKIKELNQNVKKLNKDDLFKKLMAQTEKHKKINKQLE